MRFGQSASVSLSDTRLLQEDPAELAAKLALEKEEDKQRTLVQRALADLRHGVVWLDTRASGTSGEPPGGGPQMPGSARRVELLSLCARRGGVDAVTGSLAAAEVAVASD